MAAQFITVDFILDPVREPDRRKRPGLLSAARRPSRSGPGSIDTEAKIYYLMAVLMTLMVIVLANLLRSKAGDGPGWPYGTTT
jgi:branched-chain amino acid transport system permease protein